ncbi:tripartite tricarboxylate transporter substrate binding protein [Jiella sp. MQZ9-1]|uniref:Tripartite tricarboxylate transporter substrate binding protein n=1 Tax=Jiella flava TaxID=2816857 RepID=A0A939JR98_9HYPH|nr:tripartite tricarboxylate transporter substrate binding protein [Jiella flava]MBO0661698.1 tripartite tricarboxylate transporter substrate binding protein [Jiella flava]MCD2470340.1 tripartite tricarboxylate transporter substrate binding protein [Jiella flava]
MKLKALLASAVFAFAAATGVAVAQDYPSKPVNYIIPFNAGGESDIAARLQQPVWEKITGKPLVIQYMAGAGGAQAWSQLNGLEADGYTIMGTNLPHIILQPMAQNVGYKTDDISNVYFFQYTPDAIIVPKNSQFKTLKDLIDYAKANPGIVTVSGSGTNSANDVAQTRFDKLAGVTTTYIPFSGTSPSTAAVLGGQVMAGFSYTTAAITQGDAMRVLAVAADKRVPSFPDVPTFKELGYDMVGGAYRGVAVPKSTPEEVKKQLSDVLDKINHDPDFIKKMEDGGFVVINVPYDQVPDFMAKRKAEYEAAAKDMGIAKK